MAKLVRKLVGQLSPKEIRASLARVRAQFDFPVEPEMQRVPAGKSKRQDRSPVAAVDDGKSRKVVGVSLKDVIDEGLLKPPLKLTVHYMGRDFESELLSNGTVRFQGKIYKTCSAAADSARGTVTGRRMSTNGWIFWHYRDPQGTLVPLDTARQEYLKRKATC
jgi:hypothetical protein